MARSDQTYRNFESEVTVPVQLEMEKAFRR
jgi:hypothetical protein